MVTYNACNLLGHLILQSGDNNFSWYDGLDLYSVGPKFDSNFVFIIFVIVWGFDETVGAHDLTLYWKTKDVNQETTQWSKGLLSFDAMLIVSVP